MRSLRLLVSKKRRVVVLCAAAIAIIGGVVVPVTSHAATAQRGAAFSVIHDKGSGDELLLIVGKNFAVSPVKVTFVDGTLMRQATVTPESDGRFALITYLPSNNTGPLQAVAQQGSAVTTASAA